MFSMICKSFKDCLTLSLEETQDISLWNFQFTYFTIFIFHMNMFGTLKPGLSFKTVIIFYIYIKKLHISTNINGYTKFKRLKNHSYLLKRWSTKATTKQTNKKKKTRGEEKENLQITYNL